MTPFAPAELLEWLGRHMFLAPDQVEALRPLVPTFANDRALSRELIRRDWLTPYQCNQILQGHGQRLIVGANRLLERVGEGAMGEVYRAWNVRLGRVVAVKMIHKEHLQSGKAMERFRREVRTASQLDHPNIVLVRDADEADGRTFLVMDFVEGEDLSRRVKTQGPLPIVQAVEFARQAALGLQHASERGVVHRDIKPSNLLVATGPDGAPLVKILDFGLARLDNDSITMQRLTMAGNLIGTVDYIAPEQAVDAHAADTRADVYGLGCTLFFLLTGKPPFGGNSVVEKITARRDEPPPSVRTLRPEAPTGLSLVLQKMMARAPAERYQTPLEAAQALAPFTKIGSDEIATATLRQDDLRAALASSAPKTDVAMAAPVAATGAPAMNPAPFIPAMALDNRAAGGATPATTQPAAETMEWPGPGAHDEAAFQPESFSFQAARTAVLDDPAAVPELPAKTPAAANKTGGVAVWIVAIGALMAVAAFVALRGPLIGPGDPNKRGHFSPGAALRVFQPDPVEFKDGGRKHIIVRIERQEFRGPVRIRFEGLPDGITAEEKIIADGKDIVEIPLVVSYGGGALKRELRIVASAENLQATTTLPVTVKVSGKSQ
jgi:tRNA A-37 threonylcarbamoyl transferase component Bud32